MQNLGDNSTHTKEAHRIPVSARFVEENASKDSGAYCRIESGWWTSKLTGPVIASAVIRLALMALLIARNGIGSVSQADTMSYLEPGRNLLLHGRFMADGAPDLVRTPGYPLFLAVASLAGLPFAALVNLLISVLTVILVWRLARAVSDDERIALGAAWIFAFEPVSFTYSCVLLSESLFLALLVFSMERLAVFLRSRRFFTLFAAGLWLTAATFVRPVTYYLPVALAVGLLVVFARIPSLRWKAPCVLLISVLPWLAAWQMRNWVETGYGGFSSIREVNLYFFVAADVKARIEHRPSFAVTRELGYVNFTDHSGQSYLFQPYLDLHPEQAGWSQGQRLAYMRSQAWNTLKTNAGVSLRAFIVHFFKMVFDPGAGSLDALINPGDPKHVAGLLMNQGLAQGTIVLIRTSPAVAAEKAVFAFLLFALYFFAARGVFSRRARNASLWLLLGTSLYLITISAIAGGTDSRYRQPAMPFVCIFAAAGLRRGIKVPQ